MAGSYWSRIKANFFHFEKLVTIEDRNIYGYDLRLLFKCYSFFSSCLNMINWSCSGLQDIFSYSYEVKINQMLISFHPSRLKRNKLRIEIL
jgi:hypothetical protein